jgi:hypothetical protein
VSTPERRDRLWLINGLASDHGPSSCLIAQLTPSDGSASSDHAQAQLKLSARLFLPAVRWYQD